MPHWLLGASFKREKNYLSGMQLYIIKAVMILLFSSEVFWLFSVPKTDPSGGKSGCCGVLLSEEEDNLLGFIGANPSFVRLGNQNNSELSLI